MQPTTLLHGGRLRQAASQYGIPLENWIDLSTGISPWSWPVPPVPEDVWRRLPEEDDGLDSQAAAYYGCDKSQLLATPGSQWAISTIPKLLAPSAVALPRWGYQEHGQRWRLAGHRPIYYNSPEELSQLVASAQVNCAVVINPNNPTGELMAPARLIDIAKQLHQRNGVLLVDEAFMDCTPQQSLTGGSLTGGSLAGDRLSEQPVPGLLVLRSLGKFFGLAGLRLGFVIADENWIAHLNEHLDPWAVSHPARWAGGAALADERWQQQQRKRLSQQSARWQDVLRRQLPDWPLAGCHLFTTATGSLKQCQELFHHCASVGLLARLITADEDQTLIRFGLPALEQIDEAEERLARAIHG